MPKPPDLLLVNMSVLPSGEMVGCASHAPEFIGSPRFLGLLQESPFRSETYKSHEPYPSGRSQPVK